jgi:molecular chaperone GrpE
MQHREQDVTPSAPPAERQGGEDRQIAHLEAELTRAQDQIRRAIADLENYRKRSDRELERLRTQDRAVLLRDLLPVVDNLERALTSTPDHAPISRPGVEAVYRQFLAVLKRYGVEPIEDHGQPFDPQWHEVVATTQTGATEGAITAVAERGYRHGEQPLRPARVSVETPRRDGDAEAN